MIERRGRLSWLFWPSLVLSVALHLGAVALLFMPPSGTSGAVDRPTTAISVNLETTDILDAPEQSAAMEAASSVPAAEGVKTDVEKPEETPPEPPKLAEAEPKPAGPQPQPEETQPLEAQPQPETDVAAEQERERIAEGALRKAEAEEAEHQQTVRAEAERRETQRREDERHKTEREDRLEREAENRAERRRAEEREEAREDERRQSRQRQSTGASGSQGKQATKGRVSASQGAIRNYGSAIRARIARNKPAGRNGLGSVVVLFNLSASGGLVSAKILSSSGDAAFDQRALAAVQRSSPFPPPPAGSSSSELRFTMQFNNVR